MELVRETQYSKQKNTWRLEADALCIFKFCRYIKDPGDFEWSISSLLSSSQQQSKQNKTQQHVRNQHFGKFSKLRSSLNESIFILIICLILSFRLSFWCLFTLSVPGRLKHPSRRQTPSPLMFVKDGIRPSKILIPTDSRLSPTRLPLNRIRPEATADRTVMTTQLQMSWTFPVPTPIAPSPQCSTWICPAPAVDLLKIQSRNKCLDSLPPDIKHQVASLLQLPQSPFHPNKFTYFYINRIELHVKYIQSILYKITQHWK